MAQRSFCHFYIVIFLASRFLESDATLTKDVIDFCWKEEPNSCGENGECLIQPSGNRCLCRDGFMGRGCLRPCQDIYKSCERWLEEKRCEWAKPISPFFFDNCPMTCGKCKAGNKKLRLPLPPILEPLSWLIGKWRTRTTSSGLRFPIPLSNSYDETLEFSISEVPAFDRPPLNVSVKATDLVNGDEHVEVGFMTGKPFREDTGFAVKNKPKTGDNLVAIETVGNNGHATRMSSHQKYTVIQTSLGLIIIEEGILLPDQINLGITYQKSYSIPPLLEGNRTFKLLAPHILEERVRLVLANGRVEKFRKKYIKVFDYLEDYVSH